jgi:tetratricopeptide (TPR) repeat protein
MYILQNKLEQATYWLQLEQKTLEQASFPELERKEQQVHILYYQGQICFKTGDYQGAKTILLQALEQAQVAGWQRAIAAIQNWLAEIAIKLGNLEEARGILELSLPMAERHKDKRSIAFHKAAFATLEKQLGKLEQAKRFAKEAALCFESLKMMKEAQEMRSLLNSSEC